MRPVGFGLLMGVLLGATSGSALAQNAEWRPMEFRDLRQKSSTDILQTTIWPTEVRSQNDFVEKELKAILPGVTPGSMRSYRRSNSAISASWCPS